MKDGQPCNVGSVVYRADVSDEGTGEHKFYIGSSNNFKLRYARHKQSFRDDKFSTDTGLSECVWMWKSRGLDPIIKFSVISKEKQFNPVSKKCLLCLKEKLAIMKVLEDPKNLNKKSDLMGYCPHRDKTLLSHINLMGFKPPDNFGWTQRRTEPDDNQIEEPLVAQNNVVDLSLEVLESQNNADTELLPTNNVGYQPESLEEVVQYGEGSNAGQNQTQNTQNTQVSQDFGRLRSGRVWR